MKKGILFDLDGTLWDSSAEVVEAWNKCLRERGCSKQVTVDDMHRFMGRTLDEISEMMFPNIPESERRCVINHCIEAEQAYIKNHAPRLYPNEREILTELAERYSLGIVSNCQDGYIQLYLGHCGFSELFCDFECIGRTGKAKGENIRLVMKRQKMTDCLYVGDTQGDCRAAQKAGIPFVYAAYGFGNVDHYAAALDSLNDLPAVAARLLQE